MENKTLPVAEHNDVDLHDAREAPEFEPVNWVKDPALRKLYLLCAAGLLIGSATTGYDG